MEKKILVAVENFSGFISTTFAASERQDDLVDGIVTTVSPFKTSILAKIRVDQAPAFKSLIKKQANLRAVDIELEPGDCKNKNSLALVDKKMQELEMEIKKCATNSNVINIKILAKATTAVNEKVRHQGLSSKEILFSRDQFTMEKIEVDDEDFIREKMEIRKKENIYSAKSKAKIDQPAVSANAEKGHLVFLKKDGSKLERRDLYLVTKTDDEENTVNACKLPSALSGDAPLQFQPHNIIYKLKQTDIYLSPNQPVIADTYETPEIYRPHPTPEPLPQQIEIRPAIQRKIPTPRYYPYDEEETDDEEDDGYGENNHWETGSSDTPSIGDQNSQYVHEDESDPAYDADSDGDIQAIENELQHQAALDQVEGDADDGEAAELAHLQNPVIQEPHAGQHPPRIMNQPRKPVCGDIISYCYDEDNNLWVTAKIRNKVQGYKTYYNVDLEDGGEDGLDLLLPTATDVGLWTLLDQEDWNPIRREQLLNLSDLIPSRQITPDTTISQVHSDISQPGDEHCHQEEQPYLPLHPQQALQEGQPCVLPSTWFHSKYSLDPSWNSNLLQDEKFVHRVEEVANELGDFPPNQQQLRIDMARLIVRGERFQQENSFFSKLKRVLNIR